MKKIGITVDNYKIKKFVQELDAKGYKYETVQLLKTTSAFIIEVEDDKFQEETIKIGRLCRKMDYHFKRSN